MTSAAARERSKAELRAANRRVIIDELTKAGLPMLAVAGLVARIGEESGFDPGAHNPRDPGARGSVGIFQWNRSRLDDLEAFASQQGLSASSTRTQARFLAHEILEGKESGTAGAKRLLSATTPEEAAAGAMGLARPQGYTNTDPTKGLGWQGTLRATYEFEPVAEIFQTLQGLGLGGEESEDFLVSPEMLQGLFGESGGQEPVADEADAGGGLGSVIKSVAGAWLTGADSQEVNLESSSVRTQDAESAAQAARPRPRSIAGFFDGLRGVGSTGSVPRIK